MTRNESRRIIDEDFAASQKEANKLAAETMLAKKAAMEEAKITVEQFWGEPGEDGGRESASCNSNGEIFVSAAEIQEKLSKEREREFEGVLGGPVEALVKEDAPKEAKMRGLLLQDLMLEPEQQLAAWMEAEGIEPFEIDVQIGQSAGFTISQRESRSYLEAVRRLVVWKAEVEADEQVARGGIEELYNAQIVPSAKVLMSIRDNPLERAKDRIAAAKEFLDKAREAPKKQREEGDGRTVIVLPVTELKGMQQALIESGEVEDREVYELLEGEDYCVFGEEGDD